MNKNTRNNKILLDHSIAASLDHLQVLAAMVDAVLEDNPKIAFSVNLCLEELFSNTINYGLVGESGHMVHITITLADTTLKIVYEDDAPAYNPFEQAPKPNIEAELEDRLIGGLGIHLIKSIMDSVDWHPLDQGNRITLKKLLVDM